MAVISWCITWLCVAPWLACTAQMTTTPVGIRVYRHSWLLHAGRDVLFYAVVPFLVMTTRLHPYRREARTRKHGKRPLQLRTSIGSTRCGAWLYVSVFSRFGWGWRLAMPMLFPSGLRRVLRSRLVGWFGMASSVSVFRLCQKFPSDPFACSFAALFKVW